MAKKRHTSLLSLQQAQAARFRKTRMTIDQALEDMRKAITEDARDLVTGGSPSGPERRRWLARAGHPYARGRRQFKAYMRGDDRAGDQLRGLSGRTIDRYRQGKRSISGGAKAPNLPIGTISGGLQQGLFSQRDGSKVTLGFNRRAGGAIWAVYPTGTRRMVARGFWLPGENGAMGKRVKARRKAFQDAFPKAMRT